jgi:hypothetical protein
VNPGLERFQNCGLVTVATATTTPAATAAAAAIAATATTTAAAAAAGTLFARARDVDCEGASAQFFAI